MTDQQYPEFAYRQPRSCFRTGYWYTEIGGITTLEAPLLIRGCHGLDIIGADVV